MLGTEIKVRLERELELDSTNGLLFYYAGYYCLKSIEDKVYGGMLRFIFAFD